MSFRATRFAQSLRRHWPMWVGPLVLATFAAATYACFRAPRWQATQALVVRDETSGDEATPGRFADAEAMQTTLETLAEIAQNPSVMRAALELLGPPEEGDSADWPSAGDVEHFQSGVACVAPRGAEFGKTEVVHLQVLAESRERALVFVDKLAGQIDARWQAVRQAKAHSVIQELTRAAELAQADLDASTAELETMEKEVGSDLGELRSLNSAASGDSNLRQTLSQVKSELRAAETAHETLLKQQELLAALHADPASLAATPNTVLESQVSLRQLKEGLVEAQLRTAALLGDLSGEHPRVKASIAAEEEVREKLQRELTLSLTAIRSDLSVGEARIASLQRQLATADERLKRLSSLRARYSNLVEQVQQHSQVMEKARGELADARARHSAAATVSLLTRLDSPHADDHPVGPGGGVILGAGMLGGLLIGLGLVFLKSSPPSQYGRRITDLFRGRRKTDAPGTPAETTGLRPGEVNARATEIAAPRPAGCRRDGERRQADRRG